ncbi:MAG: hypothetical protein IT360_08365 [Gemmatimonadaceae bacterium]|nr:hypothetical protein [Gemmatimonadaceae bacterium]
MRSEPLTERRLDDIAVIKLPKSLKNEMLKGMRSHQADQLAFTFGSTYLWRSMFAHSMYKQLLVVSVMAADASADSYTMYPPTFSVSPDTRGNVHTSTRGTGTTTATAAVYATGSVNEPSHIFQHVDRTRRLRIIWHAVESEASLAEGLQMIDAMAASFRLVSDPVATFGDMRDRPRREAEDRARRLELAKRMLAQEGLGGLVAGRPELKDGMYVEWMADPEPRYQLLVPLGKVKAASPSGGVPPRPAQLSSQAGASTLPGSIGWLSFTDGSWTYNNGDNAYLPFTGVAAVLSATHANKGEVFYYYTATVRVEEEDTDERLTSLGWFTAGVTDVKRLWREGTLVPGGIPDSPGQQD